MKPNFRSRMLQNKTQVVSIDSLQPKEEEKELTVVDKTTVAKKEKEKKVTPKVKSKSKTEEKKPNGMSYYATDEMIKMLNIQTKTNLSDSDLCRYLLNLASKRSVGEISEYFDDAKSTDIEKYIEFQNKFNNAKTKTFRIKAKQDLLSLNYDEFILRKNQVEIEIGTTFQNKFYTSILLLNELKIQLENA